MSILDEILAWGSSLPGWQQDAVGRLFAKGELTADDDSDLYAMLKASHGLPDPDSRIAQTLNAAHITAPKGAGQLVQLQSASRVQNVNALANDQVLSFELAGLTVVYGDNGSGKSGYSRAFKRACRARDASEPILPDASKKPGQTGKAEATFTVVVDRDVTYDVKWVDGEAAPDELSAISIFDAHCARAYVDDQGDFSYAPYGLDILSGLAKLCNRLKSRIEEEQRLKQPNTSAFVHLGATGTTTGRLVLGLHAATKPKEVEDLATLTDREIEQRALAETSLKEGNPKEKAAQLRQRAARFEALASRCTQRLALVSDEAVIQLKELVQASTAAKQAAQLAAEQFKATPGQLPGTGGDAWRSLFEAARAFASESHPHVTFPHLGVDAPCPLCQQPLGDGAARLAAFDAFVNGAAERDVRTKRDRATEAFRAMTQVDLSIGLDDALRDELRGVDEGLLGECETLVTGIKKRLADVKAACAPGGDWSTINGLSISPAEKLSPLVAKLREEAKALEAASDEKARVALDVQFKDLDARLKLAIVKDAVLDAIDKYCLQATLHKCLAAVKTTAISHKATELSEKVVSRELEARLNEEFRELNVGELHVRLKPVGTKGKTYYKLALELPGQQRPALVLSEGEQRAIAIASFLAEVNVSGMPGGIVFDDPVSSLDHRRRGLVARRLAQEAQRRQVIVFTHDLYFLCLLQQEAAQLHVAIKTQSLTRTARGFGVCDDNLPFAGATSKARASMLRQTQQQCALLHRKGEESASSELIAKAYTQLRVAWERAVEEVLFRGVVVRFKEGISTQMLKEVEVTDPDYATIEAAMTKCSKYAAHDGASTAHVATPHPDELAADIDAFDRWRLGIETRKDETRRRRSGAI